MLTRADRGVCALGRGVLGIGRGVSGPARGVFGPTAPLGRLFALGAASGSGSISAGTGRSPLGPSVFEASSEVPALSRHSRNIRWHAKPWSRPSGPFRSPPAGPPYMAGSTHLDSGTRAIVNLAL